jgi:hypothetical protein
MAKHWNQIDYGGKQLISGEDPPFIESAFNPAHFQRATSNIEMLRQLSREGKESFDQERERERGKPKIVLHHPDQTVSEAESSGDITFCSLADLPSVGSGSSDTSCSSTSSVQNIPVSSNREDTTEIGKAPTLETTRHWSDTKAHSPTIPGKNGCETKDSDCEVNEDDPTTESEDLRSSAPVVEDEPSIITSGR